MSLFKLLNSVIITLFMIIPAGCIAGHNGETRQQITDATMENIKIKIKTPDKEFCFTPADNSSAKALVGLLKKGPVTLEMEDYAGMEKVGTLPTNLPQNNRQLNTSPGDVILYQGKYFVIYYGTNSWSLTPLGKIDGVTPQELLKSLGKGSLTITLSLID